jgi:hypothetical protein
MARRDKSQAAVVRAYAETTGRPLRTAQDHAKKGHPEWLAFFNLQRSVAVRSGGPSEKAPVSVIEAQPIPAEAPAFADLDDAALTDEQRMVKVHWNLWKENAAAWSRCTAAQDGLNAAAFAKLTIEGRKAFEQSKQTLERAELAARRIVPAGEIAEVRRKVIIPLGQLMQNLETEVGPKANPPDPATAMRAIREWLKSRFLPHLEAAKAELELAA